MSKPLDLDAITAYCEAATPEPWRACTWDPMERPHVTIEAFKGAVCGPHHDLPKTREDAIFIARARTDLPLAVAELQEVRERNEALEAEAKEQALHDVEQAGVRYLLTLRNEALENGLRTAALDHHMTTHGHLRMFDVCRSPPCLKARALLEVPDA